MSDDDSAAAPASTRAAAEKRKSSRLAVNPKITVDSLAAVRKVKEIRVKKTSIIHMKRDEKMICKSREMKNIFKFVGGYNEEEGEEGGAATEEHGFNSSASSTTKSTKASKAKLNPNDMHVFIPYLEEIPFPPPKHRPVSTSKAAKAKEAAQHEEYLSLVLKNHRRNELNEKRIKTRDRDRILHALYMEKLEKEKEERLAITKKLLHTDSAESLAQIIENDTPDVEQVKASTRIESRVSFANHPPNPVTPTIATRASLAAAATAAATEPATMAENDNTLPVEYHFRYKPSKSTAADSASLDQLTVGPLVKKHQLNGIYWKEHLGPIPSKITATENRIKIRFAKVVTRSRSSSVAPSHPDDSGEAAPLKQQEKRVQNQRPKPEGGDRKGKRVKVSASETLVDEKLPVSASFSNAVLPATMLLSASKKRRIVGAGLSSNIGMAIALQVPAQPRPRGRPRKYPRPEEVANTSGNGDAVSAEVATNPTKPTKSTTISTSPIPSGNQRPHRAARNLTSYSSPNPPQPQPTATKNTTSVVPTQKPMLRKQRLMDKKGSMEKQGSSGLKTRPMRQSSSRLSHPTSSSPSSSPDSLDNFQPPPARILRNLPNPSLDKSSDGGGPAVGEGVVVGNRSVRSSRMNTAFGALLPDMKKLWFEYNDNLWDVLNSRGIY